MTNLLAFINDKRVRDWFYQIVVVVVLVGLTVFFVRNASENMLKAGIASGFGFLWRTSGIEVPFVLTGYTQAATAANLTLMFDQQARHIAYMVNATLTRGGTTLESSKDAQDAWVRTIKEKLVIGYAYDFPVTKMRSYTSGSHEIMIAYNFTKAKKKQSADEQEFNDIDNSIKNKLNKQHEEGAK